MPARQRRGPHLGDQALGVQEGPEEVFRVGLGELEILSPPQPSLSMVEDATQENIGLLYLRCQFGRSQKCIDGLRKLALAVIGDAKRQLELGTPVEAHFGGFDNRMATTKF